MVEKHSIEDSILNYPLPLLDIKSEKILRSIDKFLPYSTGFEIECDQAESFDEDLFESIPDIIHVNCDSREQRFRIPSGLKGMICLYKISQLLKEHCLITRSGIHYHIDMTEWFDSVDKEFIDLNKDWILEELDTWNYQGSYNNRDCKIDVRCYVRFDSDKKTAEFRIGEMSFDYELLIKRIIHCNKIVRRLRGEMYKYKENFRLEELKGKLKQLEEEDKVEEISLGPTQEEINQFIQNRIIRNGRTN